MEAIRHRIGIQASPAEVRTQLTTIEGIRSWWTRDVSGDPNVGGELQFLFGNPEPRLVCEVVEATERRVVWRSTIGPDGWVGNSMSFEIEPNGAETVVKFEHLWREPIDFMYHCSTKWAYFLLGMKAGLEGGKATPYPDDLQISSWG